ncbi:hypothetical protein [Coleofasciculus sp. FACHB-1120]|uniref:hypothetical protein n=1 Tax=Coleofasciculus sp. FACHB-1120 TaxID=2692783 RepID=UPI001689D2F3|nr:hypothetical protein [Coleofasciculus sp. FACHB-1120]MBD2742367.1 hypothetical protein [Coleofasciculus sp. FACHB-1120]
MQFSDRKTAPCESQPKAIFLAIAFSMKGERSRCYVQRKTTDAIALTPYHLQVRSRYPICR